MSKAIVETLRHNMRQALSTGRLIEAESILSRLKKEDSLSAATRGFELEYLIDANRLAEAEALAGQLCRLFPDSARVLFLAGKVEYRQKRYETAEAHFRESLRLYPHWRTRQWLGKALTQEGKFLEAESLLTLVLEHSRHALLDMAWLHERRGDLDAALKAYDDFLAENAGNPYAAEQRIRVRARKMEPEELITEMGALSELKEEIPPSLFPEYVGKLFETGQTPKAREQILARVDRMDARTAVQVAWICYRTQAYDLACTLFLAHLGVNRANYKYLNALQSAADKCNRVPEVAAEYERLLPESPQFHGRLRSLTRRQK